MPELKLENSLVDDRYEVRERLGLGSYAEIFVARDHQSGQREVVIKALNTSLQGTPDADLESTLIENFQNEAIALDTVRHPGGDGATQLLFEFPASFGDEIREAVPDLFGVRTEGVGGDEGVVVEREEPALADRFLVKLDAPAGGRAKRALAPSEFSNSRSQSLPDGLGELVGKWGASPASRGPGREEAALFHSDAKGRLAIRELSFSKLDQHAVPRNQSRVPIENEVAA